jgi:hypothetical protein
MLGLTCCLGPFRNLKIYACIHLLLKVRNIANNPPLVLMPRPKEQKKSDLKMTVYLRMVLRFFSPCFVRSIECYVCRVYI